MSSATTYASLQDLIDGKPDLVDYLYNDTAGPHSRTNAGLSPVPLEFTNWRDEQRAWRESAILFDQSHHMPELFVSGPDAFRLLNTIGINSFANFGPGKAKQFVACNPNGQNIGDSILYCLENESFEIVSGMPLINWVEFNAISGGYDVALRRDLATSDNRSGGRVRFRFGLDGPQAGEIFRTAVQGAAPEIPFFRTARVTIAGCEVLALRHGMAGHQGVELSGAFGDGPAVRAALLEVGARFGLRQGGTRAYFSSAFESGWIAYPVPAVFTGDALRSYREWLPATSWEARCQLGGSFYSPNIEDYYNTPWDLGYERILNFDHDFIGRDALQALSDRPHRTKVTLVWNKEDVLQVVGSLLEPGLPAKYIDLPVTDYAFMQRDAVLSLDGRSIGISTQCGYSANEREMLSLAMVDGSQSTPGTEVILVWGEPNGGSRKSRVEPHRQVHVRATVAPNPYAKTVQRMKRATIGHVA